MASTADLNSGLSRELFIESTSNSNNSIVFTFQTAPGSLARRLIDDQKLETIELEVNMINSLNKSVKPFHATGLFL